MKALIINSGIGSRMGEMTKDKPKALVSLGNDTILGRQIQILHNNGINEFIITTGPMKEMIEEMCTEEFPELTFHFVNNPRYKDTNYIYSLALTQGHIDDDIIYMHGDMVFTNDLIKKLLDSDAKNAVLLNNVQKLWKKDGKGRVIEGLVKEISVDIFDGDCFNLNQVYKLSKELFLKWLDMMQELVKKGDVRAKGDKALNILLDKGEELYAVFHQSDFIMEIDDLNDLEKWKTLVSDNDI